jgi:hypothetical protein
MHDLYFGIPDWGAAAMLYFGAAGFVVGGVIALRWWVAG